VFGQESLGLAAVAAPISRINKKPHISILSDSPASAQLRPTARDSFG
jgi:hypothetical protein